MTEETKTPTFDEALAVLEDEAAEIIRIEVENIQEAADVTAAQEPVGKLLAALMPDTGIKSTDAINVIKALFGQEDKGIEQKIIAHDQWNDWADAYADEILNEKVAETAGGEDDEG